MNTDFVIEAKYDNGVGLIEIDETRKLVRHFEMNEAESTYGGFHITLDIYEDGLIKCHQKSMSCLRYRQEHPDVITDIFTIELTNGEKINDTILELIDNIYSPFCEKNVVIESFPCQQMRIGGITPIMRMVGEANAQIQYNSGDFNHKTVRITLFKETFKTLQTLKKLYEKIVIF